MTQALSGLDGDKVKEFQFRVWQFAQGAQVQLMMHLGERLGLFKALATQESFTADGLSAVTQLHSRWLLEWLRCMAAAELLESEDGVMFAMSAEAAAVLVDEAALTYAGQALSAPRSPEYFDRLCDAFVTGIGLTYDQLGRTEAVNIDKAFGNWISHVLVPLFVPAVAGLSERLRAGARVCDLGCGSASTLRSLAAAFPDAELHGFDPSSHAIDLGRSQAQEAGLDISLHVGGSESLRRLGPFDVAITFDCLHDMVDPHLAARDILASLSEQGVWLVKEIRSSHDFARNRKNPVLAMMYATSVMVCMSSGMSETGGAGYGTLGLHPGELESLVIDAGFSSIEKFDFDDPVNLYYVVRP